MLEGLKITGTTFTSAAAADVLETALSAGHTHGIGYWGRVDDVRRTGDRVTAFVVTEHEPYTAGGAARTCKVNTAEIRAAVEAMLRDPKATDSAGWTHRLVGDDGMDGPLADAIVQVACFGAVIYA